MKPNLHRGRWGEEPRLRPQPDPLSVTQCFSGLPAANAETARRFNGVRFVARTFRAAAFMLIATLFLAVTARAQLPSCCEGKSWGLKDVKSPGGRFGHAMAYDSARGRVVLFGGHNGSSGLLGDTWEWDGFSWTLMATSGPPARQFTALAYDSRMRRTVLYGGYGGAVGTLGALGDTWLWDGAAWKPVSATNSPSVRSGHAMAYDSARARTVLFGGLAGPTGAELGDTWEFDGAQWLSVSTDPLSPGPGPRAFHAMAYGAAQGQLLLFGGKRTSALGTPTFFGDTWKWSGKAWTLLASDGPGPRALHALAYNDNCDSAILFGGLTGTGSDFLSDTWEWNGNAWALTATNAPPARDVFALAHDSAHAQTILFGGTLADLSGGGQGFFGDTWAYGPSQTPPQVLSTYAACGDQKIIVVFSAPLDPVSAQNPGNYLLACGAAGNPISLAILSDDPRIVWLYAAQPLESNPLVGCCSLTINGVRDICGHALRQYATTVCCTNEPCSISSAGRDYWLTFPGNYAPDRTNPPVPQLFISGTPGVFGSVSIPGYPAWSPAAFTIPSGGVATVTLPAVADLGNANDVIQTNGIHVVASQPVSVYGYNRLPYTTGAYLGLSTRAIGKAYMVLTYQNEFIGVPELSGAQLAVVGTLDGTTVTLVPSATVGGHPAGVPFNITLMQGQTYQLRNTNDTPADLTGTIVVADQPIAVFGSHQCANIPSGSYFFCNYIVEQMFPVTMWGSSFATVPLKTRLNGDTFRILALFNGTTVQTNGVAVPGLLNQGRFAEIRLAGNTSITSDKPIMVAQYANSSDFDMVANSDPFMVVIPPTSAYATSYVVETPTTGFTGNYLNVVAPTAAVGQVVLDNVAIPAGLFSLIPGSGYSGAQVAVGIGPHTLHTSNGLPFGVVVYGWAQYDSYAYSGGFCSGGQTLPPPQFVCPSDNIVAQAGAGCVAVVPDLTQKIGNVGAAVLVLQDPPADALVGPGSYKVTLTIVDQNGDRHICSTPLTILQSSTSGLLCPQDIVTNCASSAGRVVFYQVGLCNTNFTLKCNPPPGALFPPGVTKVSCVASSATGVIEQCGFTVTVNCPAIGIVQSKNSVTLTWQSGGTLQKASTLFGPWITLSNAVSPFPVSFSGSQGFFRVKQ